MSTQDDVTILLQTYKKGRHFSSVLFFAAFLVFFLAGFVSANGTEHLVLSQVIEKYHNLIGTLISGALCIAGFMVVQEERIYSSDTNEYWFLLSLEAICIIAFWIFLMNTSWKDLQEWFMLRRNLAVLVALGFGFLFFSLCAHTMALQTKAKAEQLSTNNGELR